MKLLHRSFVFVLFASSLAFAGDAEFRGVVERIEEDPSGVFYETLAKRYGAPWGYPGDPRVILYMKIEHIAGQNL